MKRRNLHFAIIVNSRSYFILLSNLIPSVFPGSKHNNIIMDMQHRFLQDEGKFIVSSVCPNSAPFFGFMGVVSALVFASMLSWIVKCAETYELHPIPKELNV